VTMVRRNIAVNPVNPGWFFTIFGPFYFFRRFASVNL